MLPGRRVWVRGRAISEKCHRRACIPVVALRTGEAWTGERPAARHVAQDSEHDDLDIMCPRGQSMAPSHSTERLRPSYITFLSLSAGVRCADMAVVSWSKRSGTSEQASSSSSSCYMSSESLATTGLVQTPGQKSLQVLPTPWSLFLKNVFGFSTIFIFFMMD